MPGRFAEGLGFDGPDDEAGTLQASVGAFADADLELLRQPHPLFGERLDDLNLAGRQAAFDEAANDGTGHVAAADEGNVRALFAGICCAHGCVSR